MKTENVTTSDLRRALATVNKQFGGNITLATEADRFTLGVVKSDGRGGRLGKPTKDGSRRIVYNKACWHVHGYFLEALFKEQPKAVVISPFGRITGPTKEQGNWRDAQVPNDTALFSELCHCRRAKTTLKVRRTKGLVKEAWRPNGLIGRILNDS